ncbi:carboxypeptidase regulatory-like domain-containing protein [Candidatus Daviesbacteria bacterium]|nr:carboxypeptidase regulatory-like domain-containing protein [Candidatus Daviesbacteria bacterium]
MLLNQKGIISPYILLVIVFIVIAIIYLLVNKNDFTFSDLLNFSDRIYAQTAQDLEPPTAPTNLKVTSYLGTKKDEGSRDELVWDPSTDNVGIKSYLIYQIIGPDVYDQNPIAEVETTSYTRQFNVNGYATDYTYYVVALDTNNNKSPQSNLAHMTGIWGDVLDKSNSRHINGAKIEAVSNGTTSTYIANQSGAYLMNLAPGTYDVTYSANGYVPQKFSLTVTDNQMTTRNVFLSKSRGK